MGTRLMPKKKVINNPKLEADLFGEMYAAFRNMGMASSAKQLEALRDNCSKIGKIIVKIAYQTSIQTVKALEANIYKAFDIVADDFDKLTKRIEDLEKKMEESDGRSKPKTSDSEGSDNIRLSSGGKDTEGDSEVS